MADRCGRNLSWHVVQQAHPDARAQTKVTNRSDNPKRQTEATDRHLMASTNHAAGTSQQVRLRNRANILIALQRRHELSKSQLARQLYISPATVGSIVADLMDEGLIRSVGAGPSTGGRPAERLILNGDRQVAVGVDLGGTSAQIGVLSLAGDLLAHWRMPFQFQQQEVQLEPILAGVAQALDAFDGRPILGIGVAVPGLLDLDGGTVRYAANLSWRDVPIRELFARAFDLPIVMNRNTNAALLGDDWWSDMATADPSIFVTLGSGIGAALRIDGRFVQGAASMAGELGHIPIDPDGPLCNCGQRGCLEALASGRAVQARYNQLRRTGQTPATQPRHDDPIKVITEADTPDDVTLAEVLKRAAAGERLAVEVLAEAAHVLGVGVTILTNLLNPAVIVLGGELMDAGDLLLRPIVRHIQAHALPDAASAVTVAASSLRGEASVIGAATLVFNDLFQGAIPVGKGVTRKG